MPTTGYDTSYRWPAVIATGFRLASITGAGALLVLDPGTLGLWSVVVTSAAGLIAQLLRMREERIREERRHRFEAEDRAAASVTRELIAENTQLTRENGVQAAAAFETANHVNEKIAGIAAAALRQDRATERKSTDTIRHDIADVKANL